ncbi:MAG: bifunctional precorrin-2 dehydrogenase/sirohydrochlorin ferrochelatase, partial [Hyphomonadaceae bacterium]
MRGLFPHFPVFIDVMGRPAALLGGDATMAEIAQRLLDSGAGVAVFDPAPGVEISALEGHVRLHRRRWRAADLRGAALVIAAAGEPRPQRARLAAKGAQAIFCQIGAAAQSDSALGAVVLRGPLAIGVAAHGLAPELEAAMRGRLEAALPAGLAEFFAAAAAAR